MKFFSQHGQDQFVLDNFFRGRRGGVFVDVGAYDGEKFSNTLFFERSMGWTGLCVEPLPSAFAKLRLIRRTICEQVCVSDFDGEAEFVETEAGVDEKMLSGLANTFDARHVTRLQKQATTRISRRVPVTRLSSLLARHALYDIDFCSVDTEGAELSILSELDLQRFKIKVFTIESNYEGDDRIANLMAKKGYDFVTRRVQDLIFKRHDVKRLPQISVICAVPCDIPARDALLRGHAANLARQTITIEPFYVFDGAADIPNWLEGRALSVSETLTQHQAWNVALSTVATPTVMNLNLSDRLAPDGAEILERELLTNDAVAAGGDWKVCALQTDADEVERCYPADRLPIGPMPEMAFRLGSSAHQYETLGPGALWRVEAHVRAPRYPWRLRDGTLLHGAGDVAWHTLITNILHHKIVRVPLIIGNHLRQAEDRGALSYDERPLLNDPGISVL